MATLADYPDDWEDTFLSNPNFSVVEYMRRMSEYQRLLKERQDAADASGMSEIEGAGVRSDQIYDSADPATRKAVGWGGGAFTPTEMSTGEPGEVEKTYDQWGNEVDQGNRKWGIAINKALPGIVNMIPGYNAVKAINDSINKNKNQTAATSTDTTGTTHTNVIPQFLSTVVPTFQNVWENTMPQNTATTTGANLGITPLATAITENGGGGLLEAILEAQENVAISPDLNLDNQPF